MSSDIGGVWRTVGGRKIFIKDGEDLETAMKKSGKFKNLKKKDEDEEKSSPRDAVAYFLKKGEFEKADKYISDYGLEDEREEFMNGLNYEAQKDYKDYLNSDSAFKQKYSESFKNWKEANPQLPDEEIVKILKAQQYNGELHGNSKTNLGVRQHKQDVLDSISNGRYNNLDEIRQDVRGQDVKIEKLSNQTLVISYIDDAENKVQAVYGIEKNPANRVIKIGKRKSIKKI